MWRVAAAVVALQWALAACEMCESNKYVIVPSLADSDEDEGKFELFSGKCGRFGYTPCTNVTYVFRRTALGKST